MAMPAEVAGEAQDSIRAQLAGTGISASLLRSDLVVPALGVVVRHFSVQPREVDPSAAVLLTTAVEITDGRTALPALRLDFGCADGSKFSSSIKDEDWIGAPGRPRLGQLLVAKVELVPAIASLQAGNALPEGPVTVRIQGAGRDAGFTYHCPAFVVRRPRK